MAGHRILAVIWKNDPFKIFLYTCRHLINQTFLSHASNSRLPSVISFPKSQKSVGILTIHSVSQAHTQQWMLSKLFTHFIISADKQFTRMNFSTSFLFLFFWAVLKLGVANTKKTKRKNARVPPLCITCSRRGYFRTHLGQVIRQAVFLAQHYFSNKYTLNERKQGCAGNHWWEEFLTSWETFSVVNET